MGRPQKFFCIYYSAGDIKESRRCSAAKMAATRGFQSWDPPQKLTAWSCDTSVQNLILSWQSERWTPFFVLSTRLRSCCWCCYHVDHVTSRFVRRKGWAWPVSWMENSAAPNGSGNIMELQSVKCAYAGGIRLSLRVGKRPSFLSSRWCRRLNLPVHWTTLGYANSRIANLRTGQVADATGDFACLFFVFWPLIAVFWRVYAYLNIYSASDSVKAKFHYASYFGAGSEPASVMEFGF